MRRRLYSVIGILLVLTTGLSAQARGILREGSNIVIRLTDRLSSDANRSGDTFQAILDEDLIGDGLVLIPAGTTAEGRLVEVQDAGKFGGKSRMVLALTDFRLGNASISVDTNNITVEADSSTRKNVGIIGGVAALGAIIGAVAGGGKGAAIGAAAGAATGTGAVLVMGGKDVTFEPEQRFNFVLQHDITVREDQPSARGREIHRNTAESGSAAVGDIARTLNQRAQHVWEMARNRRSDFDRQGESGYELYSALSNFANNAGLFLDSATQFRQENLRAGARRLISEAEEIGEQLDQVDATFHLREDWRSVEESVSRLSEALGLRYSERTLARTELPQSDRSFTWRGRVSGPHYVTLQGSHVTFRPLQGGRVTGSSYDLRNPLPRDAVDVKLHKVSGRGRIGIIEQPSASNGYSVLVLIEDNQSSGDMYEFQLNW